MFSPGSLDQKLLLSIAREALRAGVEGLALLQDPPTVEGTPPSTGAFVTLRKRGRLRGCIGQVGAGLPLAQVIAHCATAAALEDPRFDPVGPEELPEIEIEISVLSPLTEIAPEQIETGRHGLMVSRGSQRGLLLPQVASEMRWTARRFLEETCVKAGFGANAWSEPGTKIQAFTADVFSESKIQSEELPGRSGRAKSRYSIST